LLDLTSADAEKLPSLMLVLDDASESEEISLLLSLVLHKGRMAWSWSGLQCMQASPYSVELDQKPQF
jgi:hypothetical protein